jgi:pantothenate kinase
MKIISTFVLTTFVIIVTTAASNPSVSSNITLFFNNKMFSLLTFSHSFILPLVLFATKNNPQDTYNNNNDRMTHQEESMQDHCQRLVEKLKPILLEDNDDDLPHKKHTQYWIGLAGGPGSGKTTAATAIAEGLNKISSNSKDNNKSNNNNDDAAIVVPMDGWHIPQKELLEQYDQEKGMNRRGAPWTFDATKMYEELKVAKEAGEASLPIYSREISDPVLDGVTLKKHHKIVIVEGIYVLWKDDPNWKPIENLFDERWFVKCPTRDEQVNRLVSRSIKTWTEKKAKIWGEGEAGARKRAETNDVQNMDTVGQCEDYADEIILSK